MVSDETCMRCKFGIYQPQIEFRDCPGMVSRYALVSCRRYPIRVERRPTDWCGEYIQQEGGDE